VAPSSTSIRDDPNGRWRDDRDGESRAPSSHVPSHGTSTSAENAALRVGRTLFVKGDITADEDLLIRGRVIGSIHVHGHVLTIGRGGNVNAAIVAPKMVVQGYVAGNVELHEQLVITSGGMVVGDVKAPSMVIHEGGTLRQVTEGEMPDTGDETTQARTAGRPRGQRVDTDGVAQNPRLKVDPRERVAERGRVSSVEV
jgi:cytoskeletal protein CcmA (bactofilin family)